MHGWLAEEYRISSPTSGETLQSQVVDESEVVELARAGKSNKNK